MNVYVYLGGMVQSVNKFVHKEDLGKIVWNNVCVKMAHTVIHEMENVHAKLVLLDSFATECVHQELGEMDAVRSVTVITVQNAIQRLEDVYAHRAGEVILVKKNV